jgi:hypothetical protein
MASPPSCSTTWVTCSRATTRTRAVERGAACKVDLGAGFDLFAYADLPLERVRAELGIPPA